MKPLIPKKIVLAVGLLLVGGLVAYSWTPLAVKDDRHVFMPGSQSGSVNLESATRCDNCHGGYDRAIEPAHNWRGSMMANAARDPLWAACLTVALQDSIAVLGNPNAGDLCIRCHTPSGWLGGHSDPPNLTALAGSDFEGVSCDFCHRMVDPFSGLKQSRDLSAENNSTAVAEADLTYQQDLTVLSPLQLFDGTSFFNTATDLPTFFGNGLPNYIEATSGQYIVDSTNPKRGPRWDADPKHQWYYSRFHETKYLCATCHDVSNPALANVFLGAGVPERQAAASYYHVERTFSEFMLSDYSKSGGASTRGKILDSGITNAAKCQDCHMRDVTGAACNKRGIATRDDLALHDLTGGNVWISGILASTDQAGPTYDPYNYAILSGTKYPGAKMDVSGVQGFGQALVDGQGRAQQQLQMAADLIVAADTTSQITLKIQNNTGHKLISGFPEGRRMWLNVKFYGNDGQLLPGTEINPYAQLVTTTDAQGNAVYVSGGVLTRTRDDLVYEAEMSSSVTGEAQSFHFVLGTERYKDNRIPPKGFDIGNASSRITVPRWNGLDDSGYFSDAEYAGGYAEVTITKPAGTASWSAELYYQSTSMEYIEFLRDEINGTASTLPSSDYIVQTDPYFATLKDWGKAIYDLWLHNAGSPPVLMASVNVGAPCAAPATPENLTLSASRREVTLQWNDVTVAVGYNIYYAQGGKYTWLASASTPSYSDTSVTAGQTYCYAVTSYAECSDGSQAESGYSSASCITVPTKGGKQ